MMKPQCQVLVISVLVYAICHYVRTRDTAPFAILAAPCVLWLAYETYFTLAGCGALGVAADCVLRFSYVNISNVMPSMTAQMPNVWYLSACVLRQPGTPIYTVSDQSTVLPHVSVKLLAATVALIAIALFTFRQEKSGKSVEEKFLCIFTVASLIVPFVMTSAHENHLFLGSVFLVPFVARSSPGAFRLAVQIHLIIQCLNISGLYGEYPPGIAPFLRNHYSEGLAVVYSAVSLICFGIAMNYLARQPQKGERQV